MSLLACLACWGANAQDIHIIPQPTVVQPGQGQFALHSKTLILAQGDAPPAAQFLQGYLQDQYGLTIGIANQAKEGANIQLNYVQFSFTVLHTKNDYGIKHHAMSNNIV